LGRCRERYAALSRVPLLRRWARPGEVAQPAPALATAHALMVGRRARLDVVGTGIIVVGAGILQQHRDIITRSNGVVSRVAYSSLARLQGLNPGGGRKSRRHSLSASRTAWNLACAVLLTRWARPIQASKSSL